VEVRVTEIADVGHVGAKAASAFAMIGHCAQFTRSTINSALALLPAGGADARPKLASVGTRVYFSADSRLSTTLDDFVNETIEANGDFLVGKGLGLRAQETRGALGQFLRVQFLSQERRWLGDRSCRVITPVVSTKNGQPAQSLSRVASQTLTFSAC